MNATCSSTSSLSADGAWRFSLERARSEFGTLEAWLFSEETMSLPLDEIEREQENRGREVQRLMLQAHIQARGVGDVGPAIEVLQSDGKVIRSFNLATGGSTNARMQPKDDLRRSRGQPAGIQPCRNAFGPPARQGSCCARGFVLL